MAVKHYPRGTPRGVGFQFLVVVGCGCGASFVCAASVQDFTVHLRRLVTSLVKPITPCLIHSASAHLDKPQVVEFDPLRPTFPEASASPWLGSPERSRTVPHAMSRRRPTDADTGGVAEGSLPLLSNDLTNGKRRTPAERLGRFFRTRPVSSLLIILALCAMAMLTFSVGRSVGKAVSALFRSSPSSPASASLRDAQLPNGESKLARDAVLRAGNGTVHADDRGDGQADRDDEGKNEVAEDQPVADDEKGALIDGADDKEGIPPAGDLPIPDPVNVESPERTHTCYRKFEPGKLGSEKTLCVTDEFFFDISIGSQPIGTMRIGVFGDVVPKSAANFRALATCTSVFADDSLCFKGDSFHRIVSNFVAQGGSKATGRSIYGPTFREEKTKDHHSFLEHSEKGVVSWAEYPIGSQFFVLIRDEAKYLDGNHVVFGIVTDGMDVLDKIHDAPRTGEEPTSRVIITNCGDAHKRL